MIKLSKRSARVLTLNGKDLPPGFGSTRNRRHLAAGSLMGSWKLSRRTSGHGIDQRCPHQKFRLARAGFDQNEERVETRTNGKRHNQAHPRQGQHVKSK